MTTSETGHRLDIGNINTTSVSDGVVPLPMNMLFSETSVNVWDPYRDRFPEAFGSSGFMINLGSFVIRPGDRTVLVDTGVGQYSMWPTLWPTIQEATPGPAELMDDLKHNGIEAQDIDTVFLTHLHGDHVGWNLSKERQNWTPTFPNARYLLQNADWMHFTRPDFLDTGRRRRGGFSIMTWITTISYENATGWLKSLYNRIKGPDDNVDNIMLAHSLRPHSMEGHLALYKNVLHHTANTLPKWYLECLGVYVSLINKCEYCVRHHFEGMKRLLDDDPRSDSVFRALKASEFDSVFDSKESAGLRYAKRLTIQASDVDESAIVDLRSAGFDDGEILEVNQVVSYFAYANRMVLGLGVNTGGDVLGLSPSSGDSSDWSHR